MTEFKPNNKNDRKKVAWLMPFPIQGSGGVRTILTNANYLQIHNYDCTLFVDTKADGEFVDSVAVIKEIIEKNFGKTFCKIKLGWEIKEEFDLIFATYWETAKVVRNLSSKAKKAYFIQDFEAYFNPMGDGYILAENSYKYGLIPITIGKWLSHVMKENYTTNSFYFDFCANTEIYRNYMLEREEFSVCLIYQPEKPRRCPVIGIETLGILKYLVPEAKIYLYGSNIEGNIWFEHENLEIITERQCAELYNKCSVGLCLSSSNPSRIPFEMLASGLPVVEMYRQNNLFDMPNEGVLLAEDTPESLALAIKFLFEQPELRAKMSEFGVEYMRSRDIEAGYRQFLDIVDSIFSDNLNETKKLDKIYRAKAFKGDYTLITNVGQKKMYVTKNAADRTFSRIKRGIKEILHLGFHKYRQTKVISSITKKIIPYRIRRKIKSLLIKKYD